MHVRIAAHHPNLGLYLLHQLQVMLAFQRKWLCLR